MSGFGARPQSRDSLRVFFVFYLPLGGKVGEEEVCDAFFFFLLLKSVNHNLGLVSHWQIDLSLHFVFRNLSEPELITILE